MNWLLLFIPAAIGLELLAQEDGVFLFLLLLPFQFCRCRLVDRPSHRGTGGGTAQGKRLADFEILGSGNAAELIIALTALHAGLHNVVKASIAGSIIGNTPAGARCRHVGAGACVIPNNTSIRLAPVPQASGPHVGGDSFARQTETFQAAADTKTEGLNELSISISVVLLVAYLLNLVYALDTLIRRSSRAPMCPKKGKQISL